jgi:protein-tyrosine phosphatase/membrane-associated phospholipid phosphatase
VSEVGTVSGSHPWGRAVLWLALLGPFFFASYGLANWLASQRAHVPSIVFEWEHAIPFWPWTIVPYWIIDALYGLSLFVCTSRRELDTHAKRLLAAQVIAVVCFIAIPHRFTFDPPAADGVFGFMFDVLLGFDRPFNQIPSLHIALAVILWVLYARKVRGAMRVVVDVAFLLICGSVLTTYQHHFIDIPTGFVLGWLCVWAWPDAPLQSPWGTRSLTRDRRRLRLAAYYSAGALGCAVIASTIAGWGLWLGWGTLALAMVASFYLVLGADGFQKRPDGRLSLAARWLLAPYLAGAWLNSRWWTRAHPQPSHVADGVWIGRVPSARELARSSFASVVDLSAERSLDAGNRDVAVFPILDLTPPSHETLTAAAAAIERLCDRGPVLVCCALGYSRSACAVAAWLLATGRATTVESALASMRSARKHVVLDADHATALQPLVRPALP